MGKWLVRFFMVAAGLGVGGLAANGIGLDDLATALFTGSRTLFLAVGVVFLCKLALEIMFRQREVPLFGRPKRRR